MEVPCDPTEDICYLRFCGDGEECPPNGLERYSVYRVPASSYGLCQDGTCENECKTGALACEKEICSIEAGDTCSQ